MTRNMEHGVRGGSRARDRGHGTRDTGRGAGAGDRGRRTGAGVLGGGVGQGQVDAPTRCAVSSYFEGHSG